MRKKDILVLSNLREDARKTLTELSKATKVPVSTIYDKIREFQNGIIKKHTTIIDFSKLGFNTRANIAVKINKEQKEEFRNFVVKSFHVNSVYKINNGYDFLVECVFRHIKEMEDFMEDMDQKFKIKNKQVYYLIDEIRRESFLADPKCVDFVLNEKD